MKFGEGCYFLVFVQLFEKHGTLIERKTALIEKVSPCRASDEFQDNLYAWTRVRALSWFPTCVDPVVTSSSLRPDCKQRQAQAGPSIKPDDGERKIQYIRPKPGFVFKTVDKASNKIFVSRVAVLAA
eukprot:SAG31_NODE_424_length_15826_cov_4.954664_3_plen_127_part_00